MLGREANHSTSAGPSEPHGSRHAVVGRYFSKCTDEHGLAAYRSEVLECSRLKESGQPSTGTSGRAPTAHYDVGESVAGCCE